MPWTDILLGTAAGAVVLFVWNAIAWMGLPHHHRDFHGLDRPEGVEEGLRSSNPGPGLYTLPHWKSFEGGWKSKEFEERHKLGPNALLVVSAPGPCMQGKVFLHGFLLNLFEVFLCALLLYFAGSQLPGLLDKVLFFAGLAFLVRGTTFASHSIWMKFPWRYTMTSLFDGVVGFALVGLVLHLLGGA